MDKRKNKILIDLSSSQKRRRLQNIRNERQNTGNTSHNGNDSNSSTEDEVHRQQDEPQVHSLNDFQMLSDDESSHNDSEYSFNNIEESEFSNEENDDVENLREENVNSEISSGEEENIIPLVHLTDMKKKQSRMHF